MTKIMSNKLFIFVNSDVIRISDRYFLRRRNVIEALNTIEFNFHNILNVNKQYF
jgi:hypothetical protein